jgi:hypothetical protein
MDMVGKSSGGNRRTAFWLTAAMALGSVPAFGQSLISARSGLVSLVDGAAELEGLQVRTRPGYFPEVRENQVLKTWNGRAEVLLNPGVFLRMAENASIRMLRTKLDDARIEILAGAVVIEAAEIAKGNAVTVVVKGAEISLKKAGIYRFDMEPARLRVFAGTAAFLLNGKTVEVGAGKMVGLEGEMAFVLVKFNKDMTDELDRWSRRRGEYIAMANISSAKSLLDSGYTMYSAAWRWNPYFGTYTFIPMRGSLTSPYGHRYWSPGSVGRVFYAPPPSRGGSDGWNAASSNGYQGMSGTSSGYSGTAASSYSSDSSSSAASSNSGSSSAASSGSSSVGHGSSGSSGRGR